MEDDCSVGTDSISSSDYCESVEDEIPVNIKIPIDESDDLVTKQRKRRSRRMEILKRKRQRAYSSTKSHKKSNFVAEDISDPKLLRKLRNREAAERSRRRVTETIDALTFQVCEHYVMLQDLEDQYQKLLCQSRCGSITSSSSSYSNPSYTTPYTSDVEGMDASLNGYASPTLSDLTDDDSYAEKSGQSGECCYSLDHEGALLMEQMIEFYGQVNFNGDFDDSLNEALRLFAN